MKDMDIKSYPLMIAIVGIDPGTSTGISKVTLDTNTGEIKLADGPIRINLDSKDPSEPKVRRKKGEAKKEKDPIIYGRRLQRFGNELEKIITKDNCDVVATEMPLVHSRQRGSGTLFLLQVYGILALKTYEIFGRDPEMIGISTWKKIICGKDYSKDKKKAHTAIKKLYPSVINIKSTDALDSLCIAHSIAVRTYLEAVCDITLDDYYKGNYDKSLVPWESDTLFGV